MENFKLRTIIKNKRGGLEISVNSIVILIFAITILSLGLVFIRKMFSSTTGTFTDITGTVKQDLQSKLENSNERLAFYRDEITVAPGREGEMSFAIRNELDNDETFSFNSEEGDVGPNDQWNGDGSVLTCYSTTATEGGTVNPEFITFKTGLPEIFIESGANAIRKLFIDVKSSAPEGLYYCAMVIDDPTNPGQEYARKEFRVNVQK